jgi:hypothetical protein
MYMSEHDLPDRLAEYGGDHVDLRRIALLRVDLNDLPSFPASDKKKDTRYPWFVTGIDAGNWMRWIRTICAHSLRKQSRRRSNP